MWTVVDDGPVIQVRASIAEQEELRNLITALEKRLTRKEPEDGQPVGRPDAVV